MIEASIKIIYVYRQALVENIKKFNNDVSDWYENIFLYFCFKIMLLLEFFLLK